MTATAAIAPRTPDEPVRVLIAALGGQGGGVLTDWIVEAARASGAMVQATSTPGVSQRTGATTYYVEIVPPSPEAAPPALGLAPVPGRVDVLVCAELLEAARMLERGMSTPARTVVVASTHRVYTTREKMAPADARFDGERIIAAVHALSRRAVLLDMDAIRARHASALSAALFGAVAASGELPLTRSACEQAIREGGKGVDASLAAFDDAFEQAQRGSDAARPAPNPASSAPALPPRIAHAVDALPARVAEFARIGAVDLIAYQGLHYAAEYLDRVARIVIVEGRRRTSLPAYEVARETARHLALWMRYDDMIQVAACKVRASRHARIREAARAGPDAVVRIYDVFSPSALELAAILPRRLGAWLERRTLARRSRTGGKHRASSGSAGGIELKSSSVTGMLALRFLAALRPLRPYSLRFAREWAAIEEWLDAIEQALEAGNDANADAAPDLARLPRLLRGYGQTHATGSANFARILAAYRDDWAADPARAGAMLRDSARAALSDPLCGSRAGVSAASAAAPSAAASSRT